MDNELDPPDLTAPESDTHVLAAWRAIESLARLSGQTPLARPLRATLDEHTRTIVLEVYEAKSQTRLVASFALDDVLARWKASVVEEIGRLQMERAFLVMPPQGLQ